MIDEIRDCDDCLPLVSIITIVLNNAPRIRDTIRSVLSQNYPRVQYVVIDGGSTDGTVKIIEEFKEKISIFVSEQDCGVYDALNKGIQHASGEVIGILHSDDLFCDERVISDSIQKMCETGSELCFSDMVIVDELNGRIVRYYMAHYFSPWMLRLGWMPPHPTTFLFKSLFDEFGLYSTSYKIAGDYDFYVRIFYGRKINWTYLNRVTVKMNRGGLSNSGMASKKLIAQEITRSLRLNNVRSTPVLRWGRYLIRILELLARPGKDVCR